MRTSTLLTVLQREGRSAACCTGRPIPPWLNTQERRNSSALNAETSVHLPLYRTSQIQSDHASSVLSILKCCSMQYSPRSCPCCSVSRDHKQNHALDSSSRLNFVPSAEAICKSWQSPWPLFWSETIYAIQLEMGFRVCHGKLPWGFCNPAGCCCQAYIYTARIRWRLAAAQHAVWCGCCRPAALPLSLSPTSNAPVRHEHSAQLCCPAKLLDKLMQIK
jgi:hypothetical protein